LWALQLGRDEIIKPSSGTKSRVSFDFTVDVAQDSSPAGYMKLEAFKVKETI
jgi:hypothetical protein